MFTFTSFHKKEIENLEDETIKLRGFIFEAHAQGSDQHMDNATYNQLKQKYM